MCQIHPGGKLLSRRDKVHMTWTGVRTWAGRACFVGKSNQGMRSREKIAGGVMKVGIVGLGRMGGAMSRRLREQGFEVTGWDQNAKANQALAADGLRIAANPGDVVTGSDLIISSVTEDNGVRKIFTGAAGFLEINVAGKLFVE